MDVEREAEDSVIHSAHSYYIPSEAVLCNITFMTITAYLMAGFLIAVMACCQWPIQYGDKCVIVGSHADAGGGCHFLSGHRLCLWGKINGHAECVNETQV